MQFGQGRPFRFSLATGRPSPKLWASQSPLAVRAVQLEELHGRWLLELDAEVSSDLAQGVIKVRKVIDGHVANEGAANFVVARAAVQPAKKEE